MVTNRLLDSTQSVLGKNPKRNTSMSSSKEEDILQNSDAELLTARTYSHKPLPGVLHPLLHRYVSLLFPSL